MLNRAQHGAAGTNRVFSSRCRRSRCLWGAAAGDERPSFLPLGASMLMAAVAAAIPIAEGVDLHASGTPDSAARYRATRSVPALAIVPFGAMSRRGCRRRRYIVT